MNRADWDSLVECAASAEIAPLAPHFGIELVRCGRGFRHRDFDSLKINGRLWKRWSGKLGVLGKYNQGATVQLISEYTGLSWREAVEEIVRCEDPALYARVVESRQEERTEPMRSQTLSLQARAEKARQSLAQETGSAPVLPGRTAPDRLQLPPRSRTSGVVFQYLTKERALDPEIVTRELETGRLYQDTRRNCVFIGFAEKDRPAFACLRSTDPAYAYKQDVRGSRKAHGWRAMPDEPCGTVFVFESPIEALSYMSILKDRGQNWQRSAYLSLGGIGGAALFQYLKDMPDTKTVYLCLNNDAAGRDGTARLAKDLGPGRARILLPGSPGQDWNDALHAVRRGEKIHAQRTLDMEEAAPPEHRGSGPPHRRLSAPAR